MRTNSSCEQVLEDRRLFAASMLAFLAVLLVASVADAQEGTASYYGAGEPRSPYVATTTKGRSWRFNPELHEAAMWDVPLGAVVRVCRADRRDTPARRGTPCVVVRITDRGPARRFGRLIDLTRSAFQEIADLDEGVIRVSVERVP